MRGLRTHRRSLPPTRHPGWHPGCRCRRGSSPEHLNQQRPDCGAEYHQRHAPHEHHLALEHLEVAYRRPHILHVVLELALLIEHRLLETAYPLVGLFVACGRVSSLITLVE